MTNHYENELNKIKKYMHEHASPSIKKVQEKKSNGLEVLGLTMKDIRDIGKKVGVNQNLAESLFEYNIYEYLMLGAIISDIKTLDQECARNWLKKARSTAIVDQGLSSLYINHQDRENWLKQFMYDQDIDVRYGGFSLLSSYFRIEPLETLDHDLGVAALKYIKENLTNEPITIQNAMNNAVVMAGLHVPRLVNLAIDVAAHIGHVMPLVAKNQCNIQSASDYIKRYITQPKYSRVARLRL